MNASVKDIIRLMDMIAPRDLSESWDNIGLQVGREDQPVRTLWIALDPTPKVVSAAGGRQVDMIITHHPLLFKPLTRIDLSKPMGGIIVTAIRRQIAIFSAHTNLDSVAGGLNDLLAQMIGIIETRVLAEPKDLEKRQGIGRYGNLETAMSLGRLADTLMAQLGLFYVRIVGDPDRTLQKAALCTGSGGSLIPEVLQSGADVYVGGDFGYHAARDAEAAGLCLIDIGHFGSEHLMVNLIAEKLQEMVTKERLGVQVLPCPLEEDPFRLRLKA